MKILLVDDRPMVFTEVQAVMSSLGSTVSLVIAGSVAAARSVLSDDDTFDLLLIDLRSDGDGIRSLAELRVEHPAIPIVAIASGKTQASPLRLDALHWLLHAQAPATYDGQQTAVDEGDVGFGQVDWRYRNTAQAALRRYGLTRRQCEVLSFLMRGCSNKVIARELCLSVDTVKDHVTALLKTLKVKSRTQAVLAVSVRASRAGISDLTPRGTTLSACKPGVVASPLHHLGL